MAAISALLLIAGLVESLIWGRSGVDSSAILNQRNNSNLECDDTTAEASRASGINAASAVSPAGTKTRAIPWLAKHPPGHRP